MAMSQQDTPPFTGDTGNPHVTLSPFNHADPLSTNRRLHDQADLPVLGTIVVAGPTPDLIHVIPDCLVPPVGDEVHIDLRHVVTLQLGPATDMGNDLPPPNLECALCRKPLAATHGLQRRDYWQEVNSLLEEWKNVNDSNCPKCDRVIRVNMARHHRLVQTTYVYFWRCPVSTCPLWFTSELNGKDHIKRTHRFREGRGHSFYECLRAYGLEWFGSRSFFDQRKLATQ